MRKASAGATKHAEGCACTRCVGFSSGNSVGRQFEPGNQASLKHGATSELSLAPVRTEMDVELAADYPNLDNRRRALLADRLARVALARTWLDSRGVVRDDEGRVFDVVVQLERWSTRAEELLRELEDESRAAARGPSIVAQLQAQALERKST